MSANQPNLRRHVRSLLRWFAVHARDLPWRRTTDPYAIWVSEIMLQQTQVNAVIGYWERWMQSLPNIRALARARPEQILKLWEGLGYYHRARNLQKAAQLIVDRHAGEFPNTYDAVLALPGIGPYTAGAICSIAFNQPTPILDGNVLRVLSRFYGIRVLTSKAPVQRRLWDLARLWVITAADLKQPAGASAPAASHCSDLNQSLMELGALICTPRIPRCSSCPLRPHCAAHRLGLESHIPRLTPRPKTIVQHFSAAIVQRGNLTLLCQRPQGSINGGFWEFPNLEILKPENGERRGTALVEYLHKKLRLSVSAVKAVCQVRHSITRYRMHVDAFAITLSRKPGRALPACKWVDAAGLSHLPLTSAHRKILRWLQTQSDASFNPHPDAWAPVALGGSVPSDRARSALAEKQVRGQPGRAAKLGATLPDRPQPAN